MELKKLKIGVLGGGVSAERDISLISAKEAFKSLKAQGFDVVLIDIDSSQKSKVNQLINSYAIDLAFIALHGEFGEDGTIQAMLDELKIPYTGSGKESSKLAMDKIASKKIFNENGIATPQFKTYSASDCIAADLDYPVVIKPNLSGSSLGLSIVEQEKDLAKALKEAFNYGDDIIIEKYIVGRELTVGILDDQALAVVEIIPKKGHYDFQAKYSQGGSFFKAPAQLDKDTYQKTQKSALSAHQVLGCVDFSRVDIRLSEDNRPYVLEVNSIPGLTSHSLLPLSAKGCGINFNNLILKMMELVFYGKKKKTQKVKSI